MDDMFKQSRYNVVSISDAPSVVLFHLFLVSLALYRSTGFTNTASLYPLRVSSTSGKKLWDLDLEDGYTLH